LENIISFGQVKNFQKLDWKKLALDPRKVRYRCSRYSFLEADVMDVLILQKCVRLFFINIWDGKNSSLHYISIVPDGKRNQFNIF